MLDVVALHEKDKFSKWNISDPWPPRFERNSQKVAAYRSLADKKHILINSFWLVLQLS